MERWSWIKRRELKHSDMAQVLLLRGSRDHNIKSSYYNYPSSHYYLKCSGACQNTDWISFQLYEMGGGQRWRFLLGYRQCKWCRCKLVLQTQPSAGRRRSKLWVSNLAKVFLLSGHLKEQVLGKLHAMMPWSLMCYELFRKNLVLPPLRV